MTPVNELLEAATLTSEKDAGLDEPLAPQGQNVTDCADVLADPALSAHFQRDDEAVDARATPSGTVAYALNPLQIAGDEPLTPAANPSQAQIPALLPLARRRNHATWLDALRRGVARARPGAAARIRRVHARLADDERPRGPCPYGFRVSPSGVLVHDDDEQASLDTMVRLRRAGATCRVIAELLDAQGSRTRRGRRWRRQSVHSRLVAAGEWNRGLRTFA